MISTNDKICSLEEGCALLQRLATFMPIGLHREIAKALVGNKHVAATLHEQFGFDPFTAVLLADALHSMRCNPPTNCGVCRLLSLAA
jgi:hypothetical protein